MKTVAHTSNAILDWRFLALGLVLVFAPLSRAQTQVYSDDALVRIGNDDYKKGDYISAALFLFAYIQKNPALMTSNPDFANQVQSLYQYSRDAVWQAWNERDQLRAQAGSNSSGLTKRPPPPLNIPPK
jgi:hypothetical protein